MSDPAASVWRNACTGAALFAIDPALGGISVRAGAGPVRDAWLDLFRSYCPPSAPVRRVPPGVADDRLLGGLDLPATLRAGRPVAQTGLLAEADGGVLVLAMAERLSAGTAARIASTIDSREVAAERDGLALRAPARFGMVALDEGCDESERPPASLLDRMAFRVALDGVSRADLSERMPSPDRIAAARAACQTVRSTPADIEALVVAASQLGIASLRAPLLCLRAARAACALRGGEAVEDQDLALAAALVLAPRATQCPVAGDQQAEQQPPDDAESEKPEDDALDESERASDLPDLTDLVLAAAAAAIPPGLLAQIKSGLATPARSERGGKSGAKATAGKRGTPLGARMGALREGRLGLIDTLRAAAPWQRLRRQGLDDESARRVIVHPEDFRIKRYRERRETSAIFVVDASGSSAMQRLAEVKGAIELLLGECYVRRDNVALVAFRGKAGEIVLPPTRSLARAKRTLAGLPGGGGTPIAAGIETALALADSVRRKGQSPLIILMTDGRANIGRDGAPGRARAFEDALDAGRKVRAAGVAALAIDTSGPGPRSETPPTERLGQAMNARYVKLPYSDAARVSEVVRAATQAA